MHNPSKGETKKLKVILKLRMHIINPTYLFRCVSPNHRIYLCKPKVINPEINLVNKLFVFKLRHNSMLITLIRCFSNFGLNLQEIMHIGKQGLRHKMHVIINSDNFQSLKI